MKTLIIGDKRRSRLEEAIRVSEEQNAQPIPVNNNDFKKGEEGSVSEEGNVPPVITIPPVVPTSDFKVESLSDRYRIHNVAYEGGLRVVDFSKELLDGGKKHSQNDWVKFLENTNWGLASGPLYTSLITTLFNNQNDSQYKNLVEQVKQVFKKDFQEHYMMTSTRIKYSVSGNDQVIHDYGTKKQKTINAKIVGPDGFVKNRCGFENETEALLGTKDLIQVENAYKWASGKKPYLYRINDPQDSERALVLGIYFVDFRFFINTYDFSWPARGWLVH